jgi:hypothetical protein
VLLPKQKHRSHGTARRLTGAEQHGLPVFHVSGLTSFPARRIKRVAGSGGARGDLGQLAPRKKLLKSFSSIPERFSETLRALWHGGFFNLPLLLRQRFAAAFLRAEYQQVSAKT